MPSDSRSKCNAILYGIFLLCLKCISLHRILKKSKKKFANTAKSIQQKETASNAQRNLAHKYINNAHSNNNNRN